jgi:6-pyruvoyltetrahydropterin/6-carboxytetrahydropterin synthase
VKGIVALRHNMEVAHRLYEIAGKCEQIHGHSMWVTIEIAGSIEHGAMTADGQILEFGQIKRRLRSFMDENYDHRLLLNAADPFARPLYLIEDALPPRGNQPSAPPDVLPRSKQIFLPGLQAVAGDPTTENLAKFIFEELVQTYPTIRAVEVQETSVNMARVEA